MGAVHRLERGGSRAEVITAGAAPVALRGELAAVERAWLRGRPRTGFSMELDGLFRLGVAGRVLCQNGHGANPEPRRPRPERVAQLTGPAAFTRSSSCAQLLAKCLFGSCIWL